MQKKWTVAAAARALFVVGAVLVGGGSLAADQGSGARAQARAIEGAGRPTVTIRDCQTEAPLFSFLSMDSYIRGGSLVARKRQSALRACDGPGHLAARRWPEFHERLPVLHLRPGRHTIRAPQSVDSHQAQRGWEVVPSERYLRGL